MFMVLLYARKKTEIQPKKKIKRVGTIPVENTRFIGIDLHTMTRNRSVVVSPLIQRCGSKGRRSRAEQEWSREWSFGELNTEFGCEWTTSPFTKPARALNTFTKLCPLGKEGREKGTVMVMTMEDGRRRRTDDDGGREWENSDGGQERENGDGGWGDGGWGPR